MPGKDIWPKHAEHIICSVNHARKWGMLSKCAEEAIKGTQPRSKFHYSIRSRYHKINHKLHNDTLHQPRSNNMHNLCNNSIHPRPSSHNSNSSLLSQSCKDSRSMSMAKPGVTNVDNTDTSKEVVLH